MSTSGYYNLFSGLIREKVKAKTSEKIQSLVKFWAKKKDDAVSKCAVIIAEQDVR